MGAPIKDVEVTLVKISTKPPRFSNSSCVELSGAADAKDTVDDVTFEYGINDFDNEVEAIPGESTITVTCELSNLQPNTTYKYRLKAVDKSGLTTYSEEGAFTTIDSPSTDDLLID
jgi:hypothetical protein